MISLFSYFFLASGRQTNTSRHSLFIFAAACWACYGLASRFLSGSYLRSALATMFAIGAAVVVYLVLVIALRIITREDLKMISGGETIAKLLHIR